MDIEKNNLRFDYAKLPYGVDGESGGQNRFNWRCETLLTRNQTLIEGKRVLDLACNTGRMSYPCLALGAASVTGVEARQELIDQGKVYMKGTGFENKMEFVKDDLFGYLESAQPGQFDTILCFGFLYHTVRQVDFFRQVRRLRPDHVIVDTNVAKNYFWYGKTNLFKKPPALFVHLDNPEKTSDTTDDDGVVFWPSCSFLEEMLKVNGYPWKRLAYDPSEIKDWAGMADYKKGTRASYVGSRQT